MSLYTGYDSSNVVDRPWCLFCTVLCPVMENGQYALHSSCTSLPVIDNPLSQRVHSASDKEEPGSKYIYATNEAAMSTCQFM